jgi:hypothetical protein
MRRNEGARSQIKRLPFAVEDVTEREPSLS